MKQSDDSDATAAQSPPPEIAQQQRPEHPHILVLTQHYGHGPEHRNFGVLPTHFRAGLTEKFEREFCPHLMAWTWMESAQQDEPPCSFRLSDRGVRGCPSGQERECGIYVMHRCGGRSVASSWGKRMPPFDADPKPDKNQLRQVPPPDPAWVTE